MKYTAVTIGPIYKTIHQVKSTKAIWAASYMFSYLIKKLIVKTKVKAADVILPFFEENDLVDTLGVGLFPDRILFKNEIKNIGELIEDVIADFAKAIEGDLGNNPKIYSYLKDYIHFHHLNIESKDSNVIDELNRYLNTIMLKNKIVVYANDDILYNFFENKYYNFLVKTEFDKESKRFPSTIEIAMAEFAQKDPVAYKQSVNQLFRSVPGEDKADNQQRFIESIYQNDSLNRFKRNYQKYIAVVQADGDNIGSFIGSLYLQANKDELINEFSKQLLLFAKESVKLIQEYKGTPIYAGGDDLLFICPIAHSTIDDSENKNEGPNQGKIKIQKTVITLIDQIDEIFKTHFTKHASFKDIINKSLKKPSMSYGISISYYKFPLNQALEQGVNQLFYKAKQTCEKNAVSYAILKHSGQYIGTLFHKSRDSYKIFTELLKTKVANENYVRSITYKLEPQELVFYGIALEKEKDARNSKFENFFENNFNESEHTVKVNGKKQLIAFLEQTKELLKTIYSENPVYQEPDEVKQKFINKANLNQVYAALRFVDFINNKEER